MSFISKKKRISSYKNIYALTIPLKTQITFEFKKIQTID